MFKSIVFITKYKLIITKNTKKNKKNFIKNKKFKTKYSKNKKILKKFSRFNEPSSF